LFFAVRRGRLTYFHGFLETTREGTVQTVLLPAINVLDSSGFFEYIFSQSATTFRMKTLPVCCGFTLLLLSGCSIEKLALRSMTGLLDNTMIAVMEEEDLKLAEQAIGGDLKLLDGLVKTDPENEKMLLLACQGYTSYSLAFAEDSVDRARLLYMRGQRYGLRALTLRGIPESVFRSDPATVRRALAKLSKDDIPIVFWTVNAWGNAINLQRDNPDEIANLPTVNAMMEWVKERDSTYYYGGPFLYFGTYYGSLPPILGGNPELSKVNFDRAVKAGDGKFLMTFIYYAKTYAVQTQNEKLFKELLTRVLDAPADILPEQRLANVVAKSRARQLLARTSELF
jgi:hypothetical protein